MSDGKAPLVAVAKHLLCGALLLLFLLLLEAYLAVPPYPSWDLVQRQMNAHAPVGSQVVFCPSYLMNFAKESHGGRFNAFFTPARPDPTTSLFDSYWQLGSCRAPRRYSERLVFPHGIVAYRVHFESWSPVDPFFTGGYRSGSASVVRDGRAEVCPLAEEGFVCGRAPWERVKPVLFVVDGRRIPCLFAHPYPGAELVLEYEDLDPGTVVLGLEDYGAHDWANTEQVSIRVNDRTVHIDNGHRYEEVPFEGGALRLVVSTPNPVRRHICFNVVR